jgi:hypothetical protein
MGSVGESATIGRLFAMPYTPHSSARVREAPIERQAFHRPHSSLGTAAHYVKEVGILAPLIISEFVKDPGEKWRYIKLASIFTALVSQGMWTARLHSERNNARQHEGHRQGQG